MSNILATVSQALLVSDRERVRRSRALRGAMSSADFRQAFEQYSHPDWQGCLQKTIMKIIDHHPMAERKWHTEAFWRACEHEGVKIPYCGNPAIPLPLAGNADLSDTSRVEFPV